jgi:sugar/nucleoside kinase (ribokinase family)
VVCHGPICVDHIFDLGAQMRPKLGREVFARSYRTMLGGGAGITAITLARLGLPSAVVSRVGDDAEGRGLLTQLRAAGVDISQVELALAETTDISVAFTGPTDRGFLSHRSAGRQIAPQLGDAACLARTRHVHLCIGDASDGETWRRLLHRAHAAGATVSVDLGWQATWDRGLPRWLSEADVLFPNEQEALRLAHTRSLARACAVLGQRGAIVVITRGARGVIGYHHGHRIELPALPVHQVADPTGAGDMFAAGFLWAHLTGRSLLACLLAGSLCGARCVEQVGGLATPPSQAELEAIMNSRSCLAAWSRSSA